MILSVSSKMAAAEQFSISCLSQKALANAAAAAQLPLSDLYQTFILSMPPQMWVLLVKVPAN